MLIETVFLRDYLFTALGSTPDILERLVLGVGEDEADIRPDPQRFTIREIVAHLAHWETVVQERARLTLAEETPYLPANDLNRLMAAYASTGIAEQLALFRNRRADTMALLDGLTPEQWRRSAVRFDGPTLTLEEQAFMTTLHDTYHESQITAWREAYGCQNCQG